MVSLNSLSVCLSSITSVPLNEIEDLKQYRKVFCTIGDLLNAFAVHRLDALSSRTHVYLQVKNKAVQFNCFTIYDDLRGFTEVDSFTIQCFQHMVDSLAKKADQRNKLTDEDIYDLRHCAHSIER
jgi:hypothetical protein